MLFFGPDTISACFWIRTTSLDCYQRMKQPLSQLPITATWKFQLYTATNLDALGWFLFMQRLLGHFQLVALVEESLVSSTIDVFDRCVCVYAFVACAALVSQFGHRHCFHISTGPQEAWNRLANSFCFSGFMIFIYFHDPFEWESKTATATIAESKRCPSQRPVSPSGSGLVMFSDGPDHWNALKLWTWPKDTKGML